MFSVSFTTEINQNLKFIERMIRSEADDGEKEQVSSGIQTEIRRQLCEHARFHSNSIQLSASYISMN